MKLSELIIILIFIFMVMVFLLPFYVARIRKEVIAVNRKLNQIITLLGGQNTEGGISNHQESSEPVKHCVKCGKANPLDFRSCIVCGTPL